MYILRTLVAEMLSQLKSKFEKGRQIAAIGLGLAGAVVLATVLGAFETSELKVLEQFFKMRTSIENVDSRILVVTIDENDLARLGRWPMSDETLSDLIEKITLHEPAKIGIDLYRDFPVEPGVEALAKTFENTPNVIGIEKAIGDSVPPNRMLEALDQVAAADLMVDSDGRVRRGLLTIQTADGQMKHGLASALVLDYLSDREIYPEVISDQPRLVMQFGKSKVVRFERSDGGYTNADSGGFQVLMNYKDDESQFESISMTAVLSGQLTDEMAKGRIVLVGSTATSLNDVFYTPPSGDNLVAGIYVHAHLASQLLDAALEGRSFLRTMPGFVEWLWTGFWLAISIAASRSVLYSKVVKTEVPVWQLAARFCGSAAGLGVASYGLLSVGWWLPVVVPFVSMTAMTALGLGYRSQQLQTLAAFDELTQVANRRYFDQYLATALSIHKRLAVILCDVDFFKAYNDRYGHPAGDRCLQQVAQALQLAVRSSDMVARYGGEEFVIVLPEATEEIAVEVANRVRQQIRLQSVVHEGSEVSDWVTLSCGVATVFEGAFLTPQELVEQADRALYKAKEGGRDRSVASTWQERLVLKEVVEDEQPSKAA